MTPSDQAKIKLALKLGCPCGLQYPKLRVPQEVLERIRPRR